jgi:S-adenosylmethionine:tRNA ribosyltransferase-isomerase
MTLDQTTGKSQHHSFKDLPSFLRPGDALVLNDTKVLPARLLGVTDSGGRVEVVVTGPLGGSRLKDSGETSALIKGLRKLSPGRVIDFRNTLTAEFIRREGDAGIIRFSLKGGDLRDWMERYGRMPLPPYIKREDEPLDRERYQTVFAKHEGSCAAPTAGLHFTQEMLSEIEAKGVRIFKITLHVGPGTFRPLTEEDVTRHKLEAEHTEVTSDVYEKLIDIKSRSGRVIAVGSTATRALETAAIKGGGFSGETSLLISPGFNFRIVDALLTNFHLPRTSLLLLVSAFAGRENLLAAYGEAIRREYRFYSYGDAMLIY